MKALFLIPRVKTFLDGKEDACGHPQAPSFGSLIIAQHHLAWVGQFIAIFVTLTVTSQVLRLRPEGLSTFQSAQRLLDLGSVGWCVQKGVGFPQDPSGVGPQNKGHE